MQPDKCVTPDTGIVMSLSISHRHLLNRSKLLRFVVHHFFYHYRPCLVSTFCEKIIVYMPSFVGGGGGGGESDFPWEPFESITKYFPFCIFVVVKK